jgi:hypothetical protein
MSRKLRSETNCLNCGAEVKGHFCSECGQANYEPRESFRHILTHFITDYLHLDEKFFSSLKYLLFNPGLLTKEFNAGKRVKYVHPFRLYIFITIVFFIFQSLDFNKSSKKQKHLISIDSTTNTEINNSGLISINDTIALNDNGEVEVQQGFEAVSDTSVEQYIARQDSLPEEARDGFLKRYFNEKTLKAEEKDFNFSEKINQTFKKNIPKMMFLILPIFAFILSMFFRKKRLYYVEHFYHSVYLHSFFYLYMLIMALVAYALPTEWNVYVSIISLTGLFVYFYKSLMKVYDENAVLTLVKILFILILYFIALMILVLLNALFSFLIL